MSEGAGGGRDQPQQPQEQPRNPAGGKDSPSVPDPSAERPRLVPYEEVTDLDTGHPGQHN